MCYSNRNILITGSNCLIGQFYACLQVEIADRRGESIPEGWAVAQNGTTTTDPKQASGLRPLGGAENTCEEFNYINKLFLFVYKHFYHTFPSLQQLTNPLQE